MKGLKGFQSGPAHPKWVGGRVRDKRGFVLVRAAGNHLADVRGYAYEHRLVAEQKLGRPLVPGESVHHINGVRDDNSPENLRVVHRTRGEIRTCPCGCGTKLYQFDSSGRERKFASGHNPQRRKLTPAQEQLFVTMWESRVEVHDLAKAFRVSPVTVLNYARRLGMPKRNGTGPRKRRRTGTKAYPRDWVARWTDALGGLCAYGCGRPATQVDHIVPVVRGGSNDCWNLLPVCRKCNGSKKDKPLDHWLRTSGRVVADAALEFFAGRFELGTENNDECPCPGCIAARGPVPI
jgi:hypothetical protein